MKVSKDKRHLFSQDPKRKLAKARIQVAKRWGKLMAKDHVIRMECARLSFTETWWCIVIHLFSRYSPRKLAKATLLWLLLAKAKTQVAKGSRKIIAKDHVILTKSKRVFYTAQFDCQAHIFSKWVGLVQPPHLWSVFLCGLQLHRLKSFWPWHFGRSLRAPWLAGTSTQSM